MIPTYAAVLLLILLVAKIAVMLRARRRRQDALALAHCRSMIMETLVVRARVSGQIDAATDRQPVLVQGDTHLAAKASNQRGLRDVWGLLHHLSQLGGNTPQFDVAITRAG